MKQGTFVQLSQRSPLVEDRELCQTAGAVVQRKDLAELERCNGMNISALAEIVGQGGPTETVKQLRGKGRRWAQHVLEGPRAWILCALYIFITVTLGQAPVTLICEHAGLYEVHEDGLGKECGALLISNLLGRSFQSSPADVASSNQGDACCLSLTCS